MTGWLRYPGGLAHLSARLTRSLERVEDGEKVGIGVAWQTGCSRELLIFFDDVATTSPSASWVDPLELRGEAAGGTRPFCLRCLYWAAQEALVLDHRSLARFVEDIGSGAIPGLTWPRGLQ